MVCQEEGFEAVQKQSGTCKELTFTFTSVQVQNSGATFSILPAKLFPPSKTKNTSSQPAKSAT